MLFRKRRNGSGRRQATKESSLRRSKLGDPSYVTGVAALLAAAIPATAAINGYLKMQLEQQSREAELRLRYIDLALDDDRGASYQESVLRYLIATTDKADPFYTWATEQEARGEVVSNLESQLEILSARVETTQDLLVREQEKYVELSSRVSSQDAEISASLEAETDLLQELEEKNGSIRDLQEEASGLARDKGVLQERLRNAQIKAGNEFSATIQELQKSLAASENRIASLLRKIKRIVEAVGYSGKSTVLEKGIASWYGPNFHGRKTANGEIFDMYALTAAHKTLPFGTVVRVTNSDNGNHIIVRINDRGPFVRGRILDLSKAAAASLEMIEAGSAEVEISSLKASELAETIRSQILDEVEFSTD